MTVANEDLSRQLDVLTALARDLLSEVRRATQAVREMREELDRHKQAIAM